MKSLILCEGKSDAILLSYYLGRTCGWSSVEPPKGFTVEAEEQKGESAYWYTMGGIRTSEDLLQEFASYLTLWPADFSGQRIEFIF